MTVRLKLSYFRFSLVRFFFQANSIPLKPEGFIKPGRPTGPNCSEMSQYMQTDTLGDSLNATVMIDWSSMSFFYWNSDKLSIFDVNVPLLSDLYLVIAANLFSPLGTLLWLLPFGDCDLTALA